MNTKTLQRNAHQLAAALGLAAAAAPGSAAAQQPAGTSTSTSTARVESSVQATSGNVASTNNKITITIEKEKDGSVQKQVVVLDSDTPMADVSEIVEQLGRDGGVTRGTTSSTATTSATRKITYLGVMLAEPAATTSGFRGGYRPELPGRFPTPVDTARKAGAGIAITGVAEGSPAEAAGLKGGDILKKLDDQILVNADQFTALVHDMNEGDEIKLTIVRDGSESAVTATLGAREEPVAQAGVGGGGSAFGYNYTQPQPGQPFSGRVFRLQPDGSVATESIDPFGGAGVPVPPVPPTPPTPPTPTTPNQPPHPEGYVTPVPTPGRNQNPNQNQNQNWNQVWKEAESVRGKAMEEWRNQLQRWREEWSQTQKKMSEETRRVMQTLGEEIRRATEAAAKAQEDALKALEAWESEQARDRATESSDGQENDDDAQEDADLELDVEATDAA